MEAFSSSDLKCILHSKRANIFYLEYCRVMQKDGRVLYLSETDKDNLFFNIPIANTTVILLGNGTSITQSAVRMLSQAGVLLGFCGGSGTPLYMGCEIEWLTPQSEYRPTQYLQGWLSFWFDEEKRFKKAMLLQKSRLNFIKKVWGHDRNLIIEGFSIKTNEILHSFAEFEKLLDQKNNVQELLLAEAQLTKKLYKIASKLTGQKGFTRKHNEPLNQINKANQFLNHGNYLAYGLAASTLWVLGIPHGFAVMHGKTRRGALVFDIADLIKDAIVLPWAFICAKEDATEQEFRQQISQAFSDHKALNFMFEQVKHIALKDFCELQVTEDENNQAGEVL